MQFFLQCLNKLFSWCAHAFKNILYYILLFSLFKATLRASHYRSFLLIFSSTSFMGEKNWNINSGGSPNLEFWLCGVLYTAESKFLHDQQYSAKSQPNSKILLPVHQEPGWARIMKKNRGWKSRDTLPLGLLRSERCHWSHILINFILFSCFRVWEPRSLCPGRICWTHTGAY